MTLKSMMNVRITRRYEEITEEEQIEEL